MRRASASITFFAVASSAVALPYPASARDAPQGEGTLEEIFVTARRREERIQDVPAAVTAIDAEALARTNAFDLSDIEGTVPNLTLHIGDAKNAVAYIRGVGQIDSLSFADPGVGIYLDDVYLGRAQGAFLDIVDAQRIEVLRGPQGTLYGRNTIGGAVKYVSQPPTQEFALRGDVTVGNYQRRDVRLAINGGLNETWAARASVGYLFRDGFSHNEFDGASDGDQATVAWRIAAAGEISDRFSLELSADGSLADPDTSRTPARRTSVLGLFPASTDPFQVDVNFNGRDRVDTLGTSATGTLDIDERWTLKSISAWRSMKYDTQIDTDATPLSIFGVYVDEDQHQVSQELQAAFLTSTLSGVAGLYYFREHDVTFSGLYGPVISLVTSSRNDQINESYAAYGQLSVSITPQWSATAGLRYTFEEKSFARTQELFAPATAFPVPRGQGLEVTNFDTRADWSSWSPRAGVEFKPSEELLFYVSASRGFKSGGFDGRSNTPSQAIAYDPETMWSYETGLKATLQDGRVNLNTAIFYNDYKDLQLSSFVADGAEGFAALFTNAGRATMQGAELEMRARLTRIVSIDTAVGYLDADYDEYIGPQGIDISGEREMVNAPQWTGRLAGHLEWSTWNGLLALDADASYRSKYYTTVSSSELLAQDGAALYNAGISYRSNSERWTVRVFGKNLGDKRYITHGFDLSDSLGYQLGYYGDPRTYGFGVSVQW